MRSRSRNGTGGRPQRDERQRDVRRRFEQWANNPKCEANTISAVHNVPMWRVAEGEGLPRSMGQSPFAIQRGQTFEKALFANAGAQLVAELQRTAVLPAGHVAFEDCRLRLHGGRFRTLDESRARTSEVLTLAAARAMSAPELVAGGTISVPGGVMLPEAILVIDALVIRADIVPPLLVVGEIKTYPDRAGYTDRGELAGARAQAGVYVHGLRVVIEQELKLAGALAVSDAGFLVLSRPGFSRPSARAGEDLRYQAQRAARGFAGLHEVADRFDGKLFAAPDAEQDAAVRDAAASYEQACWTFCDRAPGCHKRALAAGDAKVLGDDVARFLGEVPLPRAVQLMSGAKPKGEAEEDVQRRISVFEAIGRAR